MEKRNNIPPNIRIYFSKLRKLINQRRFIKGSLYYLRNTCGKANCKCARGEKHISLYIQQVKNKKRRKSIIPKSKSRKILRSDINGLRNITRIFNHKLRRNKVFKI